MNHDIKQCNGFGCALVDTCARYLSYIDSVHSGAICDPCVPPEHEQECEEYIEADKSDQFYIQYAIKKDRLEAEYSKRVYELTDMIDSCLKTEEKRFLDIFEISVGDTVIVKLFDRKRFRAVLSGFVGNIDMDAKLCIRPIFNRIKKDGSTSKMPMRGIEFANIEYIYKA